jgi:hypothetical protein
MTVSPGATDLNEMLPGGRVPSGLDRRCAHTSASTATVTLSPGALEAKRTTRSWPGRQSFGELNPTQWLRSQSNCSPFISPAAM